MKRYYYNDAAVKGVFPACLWLGSWESGRAVSATNQLGRHRTPITDARRLWYQSRKLSESKYLK